MRKAIPRKPPPIPEEALKRREAAAAGTEPARLAMLAEESVALARLVARNSSSPSALLKKLGSHSDPAVRKWVTRNVNTPAQVAAQLGAQFPQQLLENPAFSLYLLECPGLLEKIGIGALRSFLRRKNCPQGLFEYASQFEDEITQLSILQNAAAPHSVVRRLAQSSHATVRDAAEMHVSTSKEIGLAIVRERFDLALKAARKAASPTTMHNALAHLLTLPRPNRSDSTDLTNWEELVVNTAKPASDVRSAVAVNPSTPVPILEQLATDDNPHVRLRVAIHKSTPLAIVEMLAADEHHYVRQLAVQNPSLPPAMLGKMATDEDASVRMSVAAHPSTPTAVLEKMARSPGFSEIVARNRSTPVTTLEMLAAGPDICTRRAAAGNGSMPPSILEKLALDHDELVRRNVAKNPSTPKTIVNMLCADQSAEAPRKISVNRMQMPSSSIDENVASDLSTSPLKLEALAQHDARSVRMAVALNSSTPPAVLELLSTDWTAGVRRNLSQNCNTPMKLLEALAQDEDYYVRGGVAESSHAPLSMRIKVLTTLATDQSDFVRGYAGELREDLAENELTSPKLLEAFSIDPDDQVRFLVASNPSTPAAALEVLARDPSRAIRSNVAENPSTPPAMLVMLAKDSDYEIRSNVAKNPSTPSATLEVLGNDALLAMLSVDWDQDDRIAVASRSSTPPHVLDYLARSVETSSAFLGRCAAAIRAPDYELALAALRQETLKSLTGPARSSFSRLLGLLQPDCPVASLAKAQRSPSWLERCAIALHPATPVSALQQLSGDGNMVVRSAAVERLRGMPADESPEKTSHLQLKRK